MRGNQLEECQKGGCEKTQDFPYIYCEWHRLTRKIMFISGVIAFFILVALMGFAIGGAL